MYQILAGFRAKSFHCEYKNVFCKNLTYLQYFPECIGRESGRELLLLIFFEIANQVL